MEGHFFAEILWFIKPETPKNTLEKNYKIVTQITKNSVCVAFIPCKIKTI